MLTMEGNNSVVTTCEVNYIFFVAFQQALTICSDWSFSMREVVRLIKSVTIRKLHYM
jgi:hypothetical protein